jgi:hypothetical protein
MKTLLKLLFTILISTASSIAVAGPGPQLWNRPTTKPVKSVEAAKPAGTTDNLSLTCTRMIVPRIGAFKQSPVMGVTCTPEMMQNDWRCQQVCRK